MTQDEMEKEILAIKERNQRVELDKAWEQSWARRIFVAAVTYVVAGLWLVSINDTYPWLKAFVPTVGYILSTLSIPFLKRYWQRHE